MAQMFTSGQRLSSVEKNVLKGVPTLPAPNLAGLPTPGAFLPAAATSKGSTDSPTTDSTGTGLTGMQLSFGTASGPGIPQVLDLPVSAATTIIKSLVAPSSAPSSSASPSVDQLVSSVVDAKPPSTATLITPLPLPNLTPVPVPATAAGDFAGASALVTSFTSTKEGVLRETKAVVSSSLDPTGDNGQEAGATRLATIEKTVLKGVELPKTLDDALAKVHVPPPQDVLKGVATLVPDAITQTSIAPPSNIFESPHLGLSNPLQPVPWYQLMAFLRSSSLGLLNALVLSLLAAFTFGDGWSVDVWNLMQKSRIEHNVLLSKLNHSAGQDVLEASTSHVSGLVNDLTSLPLSVDPPSLGPALPAPTVDAPHPSQSSKFVAKMFVAALGKGDAGLSAKAFGGIPLPDGATSNLLEAQTRMLQALPTPATNEPTGLLSTLRLASDVDSKLKTFYLTHPTLSRWMKQGFDGWQLALFMFAEGVAIVTLGFVQL